MAKVYVSIGSNVERERNVDSALAMLARQYGRLEQSTTYETQAVGFAGEPFYNLVVAFETDASPRQVATTLRHIEDQHGRQRNGGTVNVTNGLPEGKVPCNDIVYGW